MTSGPTMRVSVVVRDPETHEPVALREGESVPAWASDLVHPDDQNQPAPKRAARKSSK